MTSGLFNSGHRYLQHILMNLRPLLEGYSEAQGGCSQACIGITEGCLWLRDALGAEDPGTASEWILERVQFSGC